MIRVALIAALGLWGPVAPGGNSPNVVVDRHDAQFTEALVNHALTLSQDGRSMDAAVLFAETYETTGDPRLIYGEAVSLARAGDCETAQKRLDVFVALGPAQWDLDDVQAQIERCNAMLPGLSKQAPPPKQPTPTMDATALFAEAYAATGDPGFLYGEAMSLVRAGKCDAAVERLNAFVASGPRRAERADANRQIERCRATPRPPATVEPPASSRRWFEDPTGGVLIAVGAVSLTAGGALLGSAHALARWQTESESGFVQRRKRVGVNAGVAIGLMSVGSAALIGGVIRYLLVARRSKREAVREVVRKPSRRLSRSSR